MVKSPILTDIYIYPIKSLGGIRVEQAEVEERGLKFDRRWMLTDPFGKFITQRQIPELALFSVQLKDENLVVNHRKINVEPLIVPIHKTTEKSLFVNVWDDICFAYVVSPEANQWFSDLLKTQVKLVNLPDYTLRQKRIEKLDKNVLVSFADSSPYHIIGKKSLAELNSRLEIPVDESRFRPNLVFDGDMPYEEDRWHQFQIGEATFFHRKPCSRCKVITIDQETGKAGTEPLKTLSTYRKEKNQINFGQLFAATTFGFIRTGDPIIIK